MAGSSGGMLGLIVVSSSNGVGGVLYSLLVTSFSPGSRMLGMVWRLVKEGGINIAFL